VYHSNGLIAEILKIRFVIRVSQFITPAENTANNVTRSGKNLNAFFVSIIMAG
jgi:hypothetical protein